MSCPSSQGTRLGERGGEMPMDAAELAEIKARVERHVYYFHAKRDVRRLLAEVERLQEEHAKTLGILGTILTDIDRAKAEGRPYV